MTKRENSSLAVYLPNWVGDAIMSLPALQSLVEAGVELNVFGRPWALDLFKAMPFKIHPLPKRWLFGAKILRECPSSRMLLLRNSFSSAWMTRISGKEIIGYKTECRGMLLKRSLPQPIGLHEVEYFWRIAKFAYESWGFSQWPNQIPDTLSLKISPQDQLKATEILQKLGMTNYWMICPLATGKGEQGQQKIWPHWRELSRILKMQDKVLLACPGFGEEALCRELIPDAYILEGIHLGVYAAFLAQAQQVLANDSGPMHIATAVNPKTLGIFGVSDPHRTQPWGGHYIGERNHWPSAQEVLERLGN